MIQFVAPVTWAFRFRLRQNAKGNLWLAPLAGGVAGVILSNASVALQNAAEVPNGWNYSPGTALTVLTTIVGAAVGLTGFVVTVTVLAVQVATSSFSARYMRLWYRDRVLKGVLAVLVGTFAFSFSLLRRIGDSAPDLGVTLAGFWLGVGLVLFLVFLNRVIHRLRPVAVAELVAGAGRQSLRATTRSASRRENDDGSELAALVAGEPAFVVRTESAGAIQAINEDRLVAWAAQHEAVLVLPHACGDFASAGAGLVAVHGAEARSVEADRELRGLIALGEERTIDQDPAFALRILVDIAIRALSPAVNDPTTAVQVLNHLENSLTTIGTTPGLDGRWEFRDDAGRLRLVVPAHRWEDFLALAVTEIREYGATSIQVVRRLRTALETLREDVLPEYVEAVEHELELLDTTVGAAFGASVDLQAAVRGDRQGIGGPPGLSPS